MSQSLLGLLLLGGACGDVAFVQLLAVGEVSAPGGHSFGHGSDAFGAGGCEVGGFGKVVPEIEQFNRVSKLAFPLFQGSRIH